MGKYVTKGERIRLLQESTAALRGSLSRLLASHSDYTEWQERGMDTRSPPDLAWSKEIEDSARRTLAKATQP